MADPTTFHPPLATGVPVQMPVAEFSSDGAITLVAGGIAILSKSSAGAYTLAAPAGDGAVLILTAKTAQAHVVTATSVTAGGSGQDVGTFGGAINDSTTLVSYGGKWYPTSTRNVTWA